MQIQVKGEKTPNANWAGVKCQCEKTDILNFIEYLCKRLFLLCLRNCLSRKVHIRVTLHPLCKSTQARTAGRTLSLGGSSTPTWLSTNRLALVQHSSQGHQRGDALHLHTGQVQEPNLVTLILASHCLTFIKTYVDTENDEAVPKVSMGNSSQPQGIKLN